MSKIEQQLRAEVAELKARLLKLCGEHEAQLEAMKADHAFGLRQVLVGPTADLASAKATISELQNDVRRAMQPPTREASAPVKRRPNRRR